MLLQKAFQRITEESYNQLKSKQLLSHVFLRKKVKTHQLQPHLVVFTQDHIFYFHNNTKSKIKRYLILDFYSKFEILKDEDSNFIGIRFQRENHCPYELYSHDHHMIQAWEKQLQRKINKRGFHQEFKAIKKIGKGNFAAVYLSIRNSDNQKVAVKAFSKQQVYAQQNGKQALINEIKLLRLFNSKHVIKLLGVYQSANSLYLVQQYLQGACLNNVLQKQKLTLTQIKNITKGILLGLKEIASKNVIHRDLKPENLMFKNSSVDSDIVIIDFGLATLAHQKQYIFKRCGTPGFVAPQIVNLKDFSIKSKPISDVFSAGIILHIMLVGKSVFKGKTFNQVLIQNRVCSFLLQGQQYAHLSTDALDLLRRMLQKNPILRDSAQECLKLKFFHEDGHETQTQYSTILKGVDSMKLSGVLQDSLGKFEMHTNKQKTNKEAHSLQLKQHNDKPQTSISVKKSKFTSYRKKSGHDHEPTQ